MNQIKQATKGVKRLIAGVYQRVYYKLFDSYAYHCYYNPEEKKSRDIVASNFIEFDEDSFRSMPTYNMPEQ